MASPPSSASAAPPPAPKARERILATAVREFAARGLAGARVDVIAREAAANKQLIYYHFGSKEGLYVAALETVYRDIRAREANLALADTAPEEAMKRFVLFSFDYVIEHPEFVRLLAHENLLEARYLKSSAELVTMRTPLVDRLAQILERGREDGIFRSHVDPATLYTTIASLCFFYASNMHTLSVFLGTDLHDDEAIARYRANVVDVMLGYLTNRDASATLPAPPL
ncbi:TetR family transcriptional regulator [Acuticoccus sp. M5D2P5]|uniref:TetR/AcrR family transcriptional regulator n=1 Tax=Acuticoccus kalidii TaxID=2910977 RepID=UPI001F3E1B79|nr:TetR/AcrR family transcriptional regulator [Acuticoccus kalidii]MCF3936265.1 TetR family transcriptional regulator [Acuticoccus kalidii]